MSERGRTEAHGRYRALLAAHVLDAGSLSPDEERELEGHLESCSGCRDEEAELRSVAAILGPPDAATTFLEGPRSESAADAIPPRDLEERVVSAVLSGPGEVRTRGRRADAGRGGWDLWGLRRRPYVGVPLGILAVAVTAVVVAVGLTSLLSPGQGPPGLGETEPIAFTGAPRGVSTEAAVVAHTWGTEVDLKVEGLEPGDVYAVNIESTDGDSVGAGTFVAVADDPVECTLNGAVLRQDARTISVVDGEGNAVMRSELEPASETASVG